MSKVYLNPDIRTIDLPDSGILVVGGAQKVITELKKQRPNWTYISGEDIDVPYVSNIKFVVFLCYELTASVYFKVQNMYSVPYLFTYVTNMFLLYHAIANNLET